MAGGSLSGHDAKLVIRLLLPISRPGAVKTLSGICVHPGFDRVNAARAGRADRKPLLLGERPFAIRRRVYPRGLRSGTYVPTISAQRLALN
jgi:hypothetical protein